MVHLFGLRAWKILCPHQHDPNYDLLWRSEVTWNEAFLRTWPRKCIPVSALIAHSAAQDADLRMMGISIIEHMECYSIQVTAKRFFWWKSHLLWSTFAVSANLSNSRAALKNSIWFHVSKVTDIHLSPDFCGSGLSLKAVRWLFTLWALRSFSIQLKCASFLLLEATLTPSWSLRAACSFIPEFHEIEMLDVCKSLSALFAWILFSWIFRHLRLCCWC